jgi:hypothetical protein
MKTLETWLDIYGKSFQFTIFNKNQFHTRFGLWLTISTMFTLLIFSYIFGKDLFFKTNPKIIQETIFRDDFPKLDLSRENLIIPWRFINITAGAVDATGVLYPLFWIDMYTKNKSTNEFEYKSINLESKNCDSLDIKDALHSL